MSIKLPAHLDKYFWGDDLQALNWPTHQSYIIQTILEKGDLSAIKWLLNQCDRDELKSKIKNIKLSPQSANFWQLYL